MGRHFTREIFGLDQIVLQAKKVYHATYITVLTLIHMGRIFENVYGNFLKEIQVTSRSLKHGNRYQ